MLIRRDTFSSQNLVLNKETCPNQRLHTFHVIQPYRKYSKMHPLVIQVNSWSLRKYTVVLLLKKIFGFDQLVKYHDFAMCPSPRDLLLKYIFGKIFLRIQMLDRWSLLNKIFHYKSKLLFLNLTLLDALIMNILSWKLVLIQFFCLDRCWTNSCVRLLGIQVTTFFRRMKFYLKKKKDLYVLYEP